jgi:hypothetical protein
MSSKDASHRKRKPPQNSDPVSGTDEHTPKKNSKVRKLSMEASPSTSASLQVDTPVAATNATTSNTAFNATTEYEEVVESIGEMIQGLFQSDNAKLNDALCYTLDALNLDFITDKNKCERFVTAGGYFVLIQLLKKCLDKAIDRIPACDQVTELNEFAELTSLRKTFGVIMTFRHEESSAGIALIGGVEAVVKVMQTFPKCQALQTSACRALTCLATCNIGAVKAIESGGIEVVLAAINNHLGSAILCKSACLALYNIIWDSKEGTELLISLGGGAVLAEVRANCPDIDGVHEAVGRLTAEMMMTFQPTVRSPCKSSEIAIASPEVLAISSQLTAPKVDTGSSKMEALPSQPVAPEETTASLNNAGRKGRIYNKCRLGRKGRISPSLKVPTVSSKSRNDSQLKPEATPELVSQEPGNDRKCTSTETPEGPVGRDDRKRKNTVTILEATGEGEMESIATRVVTRNKRSAAREKRSHNTPTDASSWTVASPQMNAQAATERDSTVDYTYVSASNSEHDESIFNAEPDDQVPSIGTLVLYLFTDNIAFDAAVHALHVDLVESSTKWDHVVAVIGCVALVPIMRLVVKELVHWISKESV